VLTVRAHAKINLDLRIVATRADGYHELETVFQSIALHDTLRFTPGEGPLQLSCTPPVVPADRSNLVFRAAETLWSAAGRQGEPSGVRVEVVKEIPVQAGLGGGSADAAMTLLALRRIWDIYVSDARLRQLAATLGADVAFFLLGGTARASGRGDLLHPIAELPFHLILLARPPFGVSTTEAYRWYDASSSAPDGEPAPSRARRGWDELFPRCRNDLEAPVRARHPAIGDLISTMEAHGSVLAMMAGSGSAVFGLFDEEAGFAAAARALQAAGVAIWKSATLGRAAYWQSARLGAPEA
jgi:4-diphosphocytidyl-2-C-methyl-D-erythritol kinase